MDDSVVTLQELKVLANKLIDIHSQHANLMIENADFQLEIVDAIAQNEPQQADYSTRYEAYTAAVEALHKLQNLAKKSQQDADYIQYRYKLLDEAGLQEGELEQLEQEQYRLSHAEEIRMALETAVAALQGEQGSAIEALRLRVKDRGAFALEIRQVDEAARARRDRRRGRIERAGRSHVKQLHRPRDRHCRIGCRG